MNVDYEFGVKQYAQTDENGKPKEDMMGIFRRVARGLAQIEGTKYGKSEEEVAKYEQEFFDVMANGYFLPGGRTLKSIGVPNTYSVVNCLVLGIEDNMESIMGTLTDATLAQQIGFGCGFSFDNLRPAGTVAKATGGVASGPVGFIWMYATVSKLITNDAIRRGANMGVLSVNHPDILEFIKCKNEDVAVTDEFMTQVKNKCPDPWICKMNEKDHFLPRDIIRNSEYTGVKVYPRKITASEIWDMIVEQAWKNGEPGVIFIDTVNKKNSLPGLGRIKASNPCIPADTWVFTANGPKHPDELCTTESEYSALCDGKKYKASNFWKTGDEFVYNITTKQGYSVKATGNHQFLCPDGNWITVEDMKPGTKLMVHKHSDNTTWEGRGTFDEGYVLGSLLGDGTITNSTAVLSVWDLDEGSEHVRAAISGFKLFDSKWCNVKSRKMWSMASQKLKRLAASYGMVFQKKRPDEELIHKTSSEFQRGFISGMFDTDGSVQGNLQKGISIRLGQIDLITLDIIQKMLLRFGIVSTVYKNRKLPGKSLFPNGHGGQSYYNTKAMHELMISRSCVYLFGRRIGFLNKRKQQQVDNFILSRKRNPYQSKYQVTVETKEKSKEKVPVYDCTVADASYFDANGFVAHNCSEQLLHENDACNLGSINVGVMMTKNYTLDTKLLEKTTRTAVRMLDLVIDAVKLPTYKDPNRLKKVVEMIQNNRRIGLGMMGLADLLFRMQHMYDSKQGREVANNIMKQINETAVSESENLAVEKGPFPNMNYSTYTLPRRNAFVTCNAPTGKIARVLGASYGIEPVFSLSVPDRHGKKSIHPVLKEFLDAHGKDLYQTYWFIRERSHRYEVSEEDTKKSYEHIAQTGSIQDVEWMDSQAKDIFKTGIEIRPMDHVKMLEVIDKYCENGTSKTIILPHHAKLYDVKMIFEYVYNAGCRGCTVYRDGSRKNQPIETSVKKPTEPVIVIPHMDRDYLGMSNPDLLSSKKRKPEEDTFEQDMYGGKKCKNGQCSDD